MFEWRVLCQSDSSAVIIARAMPDIWVRNVLVAIGSAVVGGLVSGFSAYILQQRKERSSKTVSKRTTKVDRQLHKSQVK
jgi:membrane protein YqaA with SNARE-associated domain